MRRRGQEAPAVLSAGDPSAGRLRPGEPLGLYVHFPFCSVRCPYCDFAVEPLEAGPANAAAATGARGPTLPARWTEIPHDAYADAVVGEIGARAGWFAGAGPLVSIYFGGGTPGLWRPDALGRVVTAGRAIFGAAAGAELEITVEVNPGDAEPERLRALRAGGVNRLSIGLQALDDGLLAALGRNHAAAAGPAAVQAARAAGFDNLSVDLMFGVPGQTLDGWRRDVDRVIALGPEHVSAYALTVERGTTFGARERRGDLPRPDDETVARMFEHGRQAFQAAGLGPYEVSSYARAGRRARHNQLYWALGPYLGVGASAASFRPLEDGTGWRFSNPRATEVYLRQARAGQVVARHVERRSAADLENEALWLGLRKADGLDRAAHAARHGRDPVAGRDAPVAALVAAGWLAVDPGRLTLTPAGVLFADEVAARLWR